MAQIVVETTEAGRERAGGSGDARAGRAGEEDGDGRATTVRARGSAGTTARRKPSVRMTRNSVSDEYYARRGRVARSGTD